MKSCDTGWLERSKAMKEKTPLPVLVHILLPVLILSGIVLLLVPFSWGQANPPKRVVLRSVSEVLSQLGQRAGAAVYCDDLLAVERIPMPLLPDKLTETGIEEFLFQIVKSLPEGTTWGKLLLPPAPQGTVWKSEDVINFALAQAQLYGVAGTLGDGKSIEILSQPVPLDKGKSVVETLNLKPVYVVLAGKENFTGTWETTFGTMRLIQRKKHVTGTYTSNNGTLDGTVGKDGVLRFHWSESGSPSSEDNLEIFSGGKRLFFSSDFILSTGESDVTQRFFLSTPSNSAGSGSGRFTLSDDAKSFRGTWNNLDDAEAGGSEWVGKRISRKP